MKILAPAILLGILACFSLPAAAKACSGDPTAFSYKIMPAHSLRGGQQAAARAPNGCAIVCIGGNDKKGQKRICHWQ